MESRADKGKRGYLNDRKQMIILPSKFQPFSQVHPTKIIPLVWVRTPNRPIDIHLPSRYRDSLRARKGNRQKGTGDRPFLDRSFTPSHRIFISASWLLRALLSDYGYLCATLILPEGFLRVR